MGFMDWKEALGSLLRDVVEILYVGIWGPGYIYVKGCRHVKMYQVLCRMCYNNEKSLYKRWSLGERTALCRDIGPWMDQVVCGG